MDFIRNFPFFSIILAMFCGIVSSVLKGRWAKRLCLFMVTVQIALSGSVLFYTVRTGESFIYMMGHFPAPWGNEIRAGVLEALMATGFSVIMLLSLLGGLAHVFTDVEETKTNLFFILVDLLMSSLLALI